MEVTGEVHLVEETQFIGDKGFKKRLLVVKTESEYKNLVPIEFVKDNVDLLDDLSEGDEVSVGINIGGQEWKGKYFASITGWKIEKKNTQQELKFKDAEPEKSSAATRAEKIEEKFKKTLTEENVEDDLPF